ncbi:DNA alkylation repair protein [Chondromyces apiculatus]|uniref:DNA alkylation repair enzyme n=1 Tax=Chondromyces apiculatus DSM 436 TaxID=1192034 RepID=A0A017TGX4_9BACT|nr:DNA alkylation repair protein [Chondromyces apiculatus]EYF08499.1 DNA alkylation repair enzyme [Chondromyces apiculatus DSM 436]
MARARRGTARKDARGSAGEGDPRDTLRDTLGEGGVAALAEDIDAALRAAGTEERAAQEKRYLKSALDHVGTTVPEVRAIITRIGREHPGMTHDEVVALAEALWAVPVHERRFAAVELLTLFVDRLGPADLPLLERLLRTSRTWALVDGLAPKVVGPLVERHPELGETLDRWAEDEDFWIRRAALLALLEPLRAGGGDFERFARYADAMLEEKEFFIRKAIGWVLREVGKKRPERVVTWLAPRVTRAAGLTVREAVKHLPEAQQKMLLTAAARATRR